MKDSTEGGMRLYLCVAGRLLQDASRSSDVQSQALTTVKNKLQMTEDALAREKQAIITLQVLHVQ